jgi:chorismate mutase
MNESPRYPAYGYRGLRASRVERHAWATGWWTPAAAPGPGSYDERVSDIDDVPADLARLRSSIDNIDAALIHLLAERFKCTQAVGELKARRGMPPADPAREVAQVAHLRALADEAGLDPQFAEAFLNFIIAEVIHHHERIAGSGRRG